MTTKTVFPPTLSPRALVQKVPAIGWQFVIAVVIYIIASHFILSGYPEAKPHLRVNFEPLLTAPIQIQIHVASALTAFFIGLILLCAPKGFGLHKTLGWSWVIAMGLTAFSSFFISGIFENAFSPIHALSAWVLLGLPFGVAAIRRGNVKKHRETMTGMFAGAMAIAGLFTFLPGRLMWDLFIGL